MDFTRNCRPKKPAAKYLLATKTFSSNGVVKFAIGHRGLVRDSGMNRPSSGFSRVVGGRTSRTNANELGTIASGGTSLMYQHFPSAPPSPQADDVSQTFYYYGLPTYMRNVPLCRPQLNGNNGSFTGTDDHKGTQKGRKGTGKKKHTGKKSGTQKKEKRAARSKQLGRQATALREAVKSGMTTGQAASLGRIVKGRGDYTIGRSVGSNVGGWIGDKLEGFVRKIFGTGDYEIQNQNQGEIKSNSLVAGSSIPVMHSSNAGASEYFFHEFITNVNMTTAFNVTSYPIDIASSITFPWISQIAQNYQQWELVGCIFFLRSLSSNTAIAPTQGMGSVFGSVRYDVASEAPTSKSEILNSMFSSSAKPSENQALPVECDKKMTIVSPLKVAAIGAIPVDYQFYRMGYLDIATEGAPNDYPDALELHVTYHVRLLKPRTEVSASGASFLMDLAGDDPLRLYKPLPDTTLVQQPRVNTIGIILSPTQDRISWPLNTPTGSYWMVVSVIQGTTIDDIYTANPAGSGGMIQAKPLKDQTAYAYFTAVSSGNHGCNNMGAVAFFEYSGGGTQTLLPTVSWTKQTGSTFPGAAVGTLLVVQCPSTFFTGLQSTEEANYSRVEFFKFLLDKVAQRSSKHTPPIGLGRVVDWVHQFKKKAVWSRSTVLPVASEPFDLTYSQALSVLSQYVDADECVTKRTTCEAKGLSVDIEDADGYDCVRRPQLNGSNGTVTGTDDVVNEYKESSPAPAWYVQASIDEASMRFGGAMLKEPEEEAVGPDVSELQSEVAESESDLLTYLKSCVPLSMFTQTPLVKSQLNGSNGSHTGTDDVDECTCPGPKRSHADFHRHIVNVNPVGLCVEGHSVRHTMKVCKDKGWKRPDLMMVRATNRDVWLWVAPERRLAKRLMAQEPQRVWTLDKVCQVQCYAANGVYCTHLHSDYDPPMVLAAAVQPVVTPQINGAQGEYTGTDDLPEGVECKNERQCEGGNHSHRVRNPKDGASRRLAEATRNRTANLKLRICSAVSPAECDDPTHYHHENLDPGAYSLVTVAETKEEAAAQKKMNAMLRDIVKNQERREEKADEIDDFLGRGIRFQDEDYSAKLQVSKFAPPPPVTAPKKSVPGVTIEKTVVVTTLQELIDDAKRVEAIPLGLSPKSMSRLVKAEVRESKMVDEQGEAKSNNGVFFVPSIVIPLKSCLNPKAAVFMPQKSVVNKTVEEKSAIKVVEEVCLDMKHTDEDAKQEVRGLNHNALGVPEPIVVASVSPASKDTTIDIFFQTSYSPFHKCSYDHMLNLNHHEYKGPQSAAARLTLAQYGQGVVRPPAVMSELSMNPTHSVCVDLPFGTCPVKHNEDYDYRVNSIYHRFCRMARLELYSDVMRLFMRRGNKVIKLAKWLDTELIPGTERSAVITLDEMEGKARMEDVKTGCARVNVRASALLLCPAAPEASYPSAPLSTLKKIKSKVLFRSAPVVPDLIVPLGTNGCFENREGKNEWRKADLEIPKVVDDGKFVVQGVKLYSVIEVTTHRSWWQDIKRSIKTHMPFSHLDYTYLANEAFDPLVLAERNSYSENKLDSWRFGFKRGQRAPYSIEMNSSTAYYIAAGFKSFKVVNIYKKLYDELMSLVALDGQRLNYRSAVMPGKKPGEYTMRPTFIDAVRKHVYSLPSADEYQQVDRFTLINTMLYYAQQKYVEGIEEQTAMPISAAPVFERRGRYAASHVTETPSELGPVSVQSSNRTVTTIPLKFGRG